MRSALGLPAYQAVTNCNYNARGGRRESGRPSNSLAWTRDKSSTYRCSKRVVRWVRVRAMRMHVASVRRFPPVAPASGALPTSCGASADGSLIVTANGPHRLPYIFSIITWRAVFATSRVSTLPRASLAFATAGFGASAFSSLGQSVPQRKRHSWPSSRQTPTVQQASPHGLIDHRA